MRRILMSAMFVVASLGEAAGQIRPDVLHYTFDSWVGTVQNQAVPGAGFAQAILSDHTIGGRGQFRTALVGAGGGSDDAHVDTGWATDLGSGSWTVSFWVDLSAAGAQTSFGYLFGDITAGGFRAFVNGPLVLGLGGPGTLMVRGPFLDMTLILGPPVSGGHRVAITYEAQTSTMRGYVDEILQSTIVQPTVSITGPGPFLIGAYGTSTALGLGQRLDEFRVWRRALPLNELQSLSRAHLATNFLGADPWQLNSPQASLFPRLGTLLQSAPSTMLVPPMTPGALDLSSTLTGQPFDLVLAAGAPLSRPMAAIEAIDGQVLNLDPLAPIWLSLFNGFQSPPFLPQSFGFIAPPVLDLTAQAAILDPSTASGLSLTQAVHLRGQ